MGTEPPHGKGDWLQYLRDNLPRDKHGNYGALDDLKIHISDRVVEDAQRSIRKLLPVPYNEFFPQIIISYATGYRKATNDSPGKLLAAGVVTALFEQGCPCYSDLLTPSGRSWSDYMMRIYSRRANAQIMIVLMTQAFFRSVWCLEEVSYALEHDCIILPVRVEEKSESGKEISRDLESMWPDKVLDEWAEKKGLNDCGPKGRVKISELNRSWSVVTHKLMNTASIPAQGSLLNNEKVITQLVSDVKENLGSTENAFEAAENCGDREHHPEHHLSPEEEGPRVLPVFQAAPLVYEDGRGGLHSINPLDFDSERNYFTEALEGANVIPVFKPATPDLLSRFLAEGHDMLHLSSHGHSVYAAIENGWGRLQTLLYEDLIRWIRKSRKKKLKFIFISACASREAGDALVKAGVVDHVVCCREKGKDLRSDVAAEFTKHFYMALVHGNTVKVSFELGLEGVKHSGIDNVEEGMKQFALLPEGGNHCVHISGLTSALGDELQIEPMANTGIPHGPWPIGREVDMYKVLQNLCDARLVRVTGRRGIGKGTVSKAVGDYLNKRKTWGEIFWLRATKNPQSLYMQLCRELLRRSQHLSFLSDHPTEDDVCDKLRDMLHDKKAVVIIDARRASDESMRSVGDFLHGLFELTKQVKVIAIHQLDNHVCSPDPSGYPFVERDIALEPLGFNDTALIFAENCPHMPCKSRMLPSELQPRYSHDMFKLLGEGVPARILISAKNMTFDECNDKLMNKEYNIALNDFGRCYQLQEEYENASTLKIIDVYFAMQIPSSMLDDLSHRPKHESDLRSIKKSITKGNLEELKALDSIYLTDARRKDIESDFQSSHVRLFVWCAEGIDESDCGVEELSLHCFRSIFKRQKPEVMVVCMAYGAKLTAKTLHEMGVRKVIWIRMDLYGANLFSQRVKKLLLFCANMLTTSKRDLFNETVDIWREKARELDPSSVCDYFADDTPLPPTRSDTGFGDKDTPDVTVKVRDRCKMDGFKSRDLKKLKLDFADVPLLDDMKENVLEHGHHEDRRQFFVISHCESREREETWDRARALALYVCYEVARNGELVFDYVYRIASNMDAQNVQKALEDTSDRALVWVDFVDDKNPPFDSAEAAQGWIDGFGEDPTLILLFTTGASHHDLVGRVVCGLSESIQGNPEKKLEAPEGPQIAVGQVNVVLAIRSYESTTDGTKQALLDRISNAKLLRDAVTQCVRDRKSSVIDPRLNEIKVYRDDENYTQMRVCIANLKNLKRLLDIVFLGEGAKRIAAALSQHVDVVKFDYSAFASYYEKVMMQMDTLTDHQRDIMAKCNGLEMVRIEGGAGTGKTFIALNNIIDYLHLRGEEKNCVLYVCRNTSLAFDFAKRLCHRVAREEVPKFLRRIVFLSEDTEYPTGFKLELKMGTLEVSLASSNHSLPYGRVVVDEAHDVFRKHEGGTGNVFREKVASMVGSHQYRQTYLSEESKLHHCDRPQLMLLSDVSQASVPESEILYPSEGLEVVELTEVCRNSKRVIAGAMSFQLTAKSQTSFAHESDGLPLRANLFSPAIGETSRFSTYAKKVVETIKEILASCHGLDLHDRLAVIVPDEVFREGLCEGGDGLVELLNRHKDDLGQRLVPVRALQASRAVNLGTHSHDNRWIIVDTVAEMDGLERLAVLGVGLDEAIGDDKQKLKLVCSRIYRAFTRAHLIFCLVNERIAGGWFNFIDQMEKEPDAFSFEKVVEHSNDAATEIMARDYKPAAAPSAPLSGAESTIDPSLIDISEYLPFDNVRNNASPRYSQRPLEGTGADDMSGARDSFRREQKKLPNLGIFITNAEEDVKFGDHVESNGFVPWEAALDEVEAVPRVDWSGVDGIVSTMRRLPFHAAVQEWGCGRMAILAFKNSDKQVSIAKSGGIDVVLSAMRQHSSHAGVQLHGCGVLSNLADENYDKKVLIAKSGGTETILSAMQQRDNKVLIAESGGIDVVLSAMQQHPLHAGVQYHGCRALWNLAEDYDKNRVLIAESGSIDVILSAMRHHASDAGVQQVGCGALWNLAENVDNQVLIAESGGIETIVSAMQQHLSNDDVQQAGCGATARLAFKNNDNRVLIAQCGGIDVVLSAMRQHPSHAGVQLHGCRVLSYLADDYYLNQTLIADKGGIDVVLSATRQHPTHAGVEEAGCQALWSLAYNNNGNKVLIAQRSDGIDVVRSAMRHHPSHAGVQEWGYEALRSFGFRPTLTYQPWL